MDLSADLACVAGIGGLFREISGDWAALLGWTETELLSRTFIELVHAEDADATQAQLDAAREGGAASSVSRTGSWPRTGQSGGCSGRRSECLRNGPSAPSRAT
ncbi:PAS domain S-box protein [Arthrobacter livingstonensis]|uniref:PAS domain S-box protein n=1 Tax=Arthrobacter livingstonensis TaxID=670078 RepID=UPI001474E8CD